MKTDIAVVVWIGMVMLTTGCATNSSQQSSIERITPEQLAKILPQPVANMNLDEIVHLSQQSVSADEIITKIKLSNSRYELMPSQALDLSKKGVDAKVLDFMHENNELAKQNAVADEINRREKAKLDAQQQLRLQQETERNRYNNAFCDPFWPNYGCYPYGFAPYGYSPYWRGRGGFGHRLGR